MILILSATEGLDIFPDKADVIASDGFTGNIMLKEMQALYNIYRRRNLKDEFIDRFIYEPHGDTPILGINSNVILGHGISNAIAIKI